MERISIEQMPEVKTEEQKRHLVRYIKFINSRPERKLKQKGFDTHHIYPKSMAKKNNIEDYNGDWNLIELTHREHFIAHMILFYCGYKEMVFAFSMFESKDSRTYEKVQEEKNKILKTFVWITDGKITKRVFLENIEDYDLTVWTRGQTVTEEVKTIRQDVGKRYSTSRWMNNGNDCVFARDFEIEDFSTLGYIFGRLNQKPTTKDTITINNGLLQKLVKKENLSEFINNGWVLGVKGDNIRHGFTVINKDNESKIIDKSELKQYTDNGWVYGYYRDPDKQYNNTKGYKQMYKDLSQKVVKPEEVTYYLSQGWSLGIIPEFSKNRKGTTGKIVYNNGNHLVKLDPGIEPPVGFVLGNLPTTKGKVFITNGFVNKAVLPTESILLGWRRGQTKGNKK